MKREERKHMIYSMTGYGRASAVMDGREITVELRSVNARYFEYTSRIPRSCAFLASSKRCWAAASPGARWKSA